jgi:hypothetical protein
LLGKSCGATEKVASEASIHGLIVTIVRWSGPGRGLISYGRK